MRNRKRDIGKVRVVEREGSDAGNATVRLETVSVTVILLVIAVCLIAPYVPTVHVGPSIPVSDPLDLAKEFPVMVTAIVSATTALLAIVFAVILLALDVAGTAFGVHDRKGVLGATPIVVLRSLYVGTIGFGLCGLITQKAMPQSSLLLSYITVAAFGLSVVLTIPLIKSYITSRLTPDRVSGLKKRVTVGMLANYDPVPQAFESDEYLLGTNRDWTLSKDELHSLVRIGSRALQDNDAGLSTEVMNAIAGSCIAAQSDDFGAIYDLAREAAVLRRDIFIARVWTIARRLDADLKTNRKTLRLRNLVAHTIDACIDSGVMADIVSGGVDLLWLLSSDLIHASPQGETSAQTYGIYAHLVNASINLGRVHYLSSMYKALMLTGLCLSNHNMKARTAFSTTHVGLLEKCLLNGVSRSYLLPPSQKKTYAPILKVQLTEAQGLILRVLDQGVFPVALINELGNAAVVLLTQQPLDKWQVPHFEYAIATLSAAVTKSAEVGPPWLARKATSCISQWAASLQEADEGTDSRVSSLVGDLVAQCAAAPREGTDWPGGE